VSEQPHQWLEGLVAQDEKGRKEQETLEGKVSSVTEGGRTW
jgi:hypothetical protein